jgi:hypothetical protein
VKNGPRTELSVAGLLFGSETTSAGLLIASTTAETPSISDRRMNSCLVSVQVFPTRVKNSIAAIHSAVVTLWRDQSRFLIVYTDIILGLRNKLVSVRNEIPEDEPHTPVILMSARPDNQDRKHTHSSGAVSVILRRLSVMISCLSGYCHFFFRMHQRCETICTYWEVKFRRRNAIGDSLVLQGLARVGHGGNAGLESNEMRLV